MIKSQISNSKECIRITNEIKEDMYKHLNTFKENANKQLNEFKEDTNSWMK
jgi:hypothetical protein